ncbi:MAG: efflux RND transporter periplasmic adaptor subunit, partial [Betaproteobacteria bacterium]|nr:efflux RND transporter periplasmic adaptor subunit [Betaproteobacteria bacterium]
MTQPSPPDISKLKIDRAAMPVRRRRRRWVLWVGIAIVIAAVAIALTMQPRPVTVQTTPVVTTYPSQQYVLLNSTGYVV